MSLIIEAAQFARNAHGDQRRKFTGYPYITHPLRVAGMTSLIYGATDIQVAAAWLHDVVEDCGVTEAHLLAAGFPAETVSLVLELTNPSTRIRAPREERKRIDREHIAAASYWARVLKCLDRLDNCRELSPCDGFTPVYCNETHLLIQAIALSSEEPIFGGLIGDIQDELDRLSHPELLDDFSD